MTDMKTRAKNYKKNAVIKKNIVIKKTHKKYGHELWCIFCKLPTISGYPETMRRDSTGVIINFNHYGVNNKNTGWHVDHYKPQSMFPELTYVLSNLNALNWRSNIQKGNKFNHLDQRNHYDMMEKNHSLKHRKRRDTTLEEGQLYHIYLTPKIKEPRIGCVVEITKYFVRVQCDSSEYMVYNDTRLFEHIQQR